MIKADLNWIAEVLGVSPKLPNDAQSIDGSAVIGEISTDSRTISPGQVFLALKGPNFDGTKFVADVKDKGAIAVVVDRLVDVDIPQFVVADTLKALGALGKAVKAVVNPTIIAMTGSVGKTSVKEMCTAIMSQKGQVLSTNGNFNNEIGVPLTLLRLEPQHEFAVIELGANHIGEIDYTSSLTEPHVAILNNVAEAHLEGFGSLFGIVEAKGEIFNHLQEGGVAIINADAEQAHKEYWLGNLTKQFERKSGRVMQFGLNQAFHGDVDTTYATDINLNDSGCAEFVLHAAPALFSEQVEPKSINISLTVPGEHNVKNALAAATACLQIGASLDDVQRGLATMAKVKGRVNLQPVDDQLLLIDDSYNANVQSVKAAIDLLSTYASKQILVLGDMAELGEDAQKYHTEIGQYAKQKGIESLYSFGVLSQSASAEFKESGFHFSSKQALVSHLLEQLEQYRQAGQKATVLVKGSRSAKMELVIEQVFAERKRQEQE
ncbi:UDP-N-acetylmuramoyl-tripeptide--D-alanyl-D-alanine ligase [Psychrosphaera ytuae]|uniref:UDP-N-acetylmuramoyl-tripeptide--D-alanyl-D-alanine ligase n=1 Tax=Psychrosphaera ytuae TaxID=2820710 RepID=A0A975DDU5_9GAMM|nr:UDP-N-acetylmuramoyl-tripeptide--D-alanyl-D-alanine ligase [Psychrosphaera ytuae]QTH65088.1 UDP-N-acetylmuramoyl-tripeptide--D-alanyl-D-alanine ligase [Psychrosphaera ytuae]